MLEGPENPQTIWIAHADMVPSLIKALLNHGFKKLEPSMETKKYWSDDYLWYYDDHRNLVTINKAKKKGERIVTCTQGAKPIVSDTFTGLDGFRIARDEDF